MAICCWAPVRIGMVNMNPLGDLRVTIVAGWTWESDTGGFPLLSKPQRRLIYGLSAVVKPL